MSSPLLAVPDGLLHWSVNTGKYVDKSNFFQEQCFQKRGTCTHLVKKAVPRRYFGRFLKRWEKENNIGKNITPKNICSSYLNLNRQENIY